MSRMGIYLLLQLAHRHLLQVLQVRVEQVAAHQFDPKDRLDDVSDGAVIWQADLLGRVHEVTSAIEARGWKACLSSEPKEGSWACESDFLPRCLYLAQGVIFKARPRLTQKPAPPVANQKLTGLWKTNTDHKH